MKRQRVLISTLALALLLSLAVGLSHAQGPGPQGEVSSQATLGTAFTYQGRLTDGGSPANGDYDLQFKLYDAASDGTQIGSTVTENDVNVSDGLFTVQLDFGSGAFDGNARYLEIGVRPGSSTGAYTTLSPRQAITPSPYALALPGLWTDENATSPNLIGGYSGNAVTSGVVGATIGGGGSADDCGGSPCINRVTDGYGTVSGGYNNRAGDDAGTTGDAMYATVGGGYGNIASGIGSTVSGGWNITVTTQYATVSGGYENLADGEGGSFIGGGRYNTVNAGGNATIGGGYNNTASNWSATIGGGDYNTNQGSRGTIGGGEGNTITWDGERATIGGGQDNTVSAEFATVPGGTQAAATHYGEMAYASGTFSTTGDAQTSLYVLRNTTTDATQTELFLDGAAERITLIDGRTLTFDALVVGRSNAGESAGYRIFGVIERDGSTTTMVGASGQAFGEDDTAWDAIAAADDSNEALVIRVTGNTGDTVHWVAVVRTAEVEY